MELLLGRLTEQPEEAESALAEDTLDAVRVLTIHKAKGLEFPLVILAGLHHGDGAGRGAGPAAHLARLVHRAYRGSTWATIAAWVRSWRRRKRVTREQAERSRLFYVGMTRARESLVLSGAVSRRRARGALLDLLEQATGSELGRTDQPDISYRACPRCAKPFCRLRSSALQAPRKPWYWKPVVSGGGAGDALGAAGSAI